MFKSTFFLTILSSLIVQQVSADSKVVELVDAKNFCLLMPKSNTITVGASEGDAVSYCTGDNTSVGGKYLDPAAITGSHYLKTNDYVQITGTIDYKKTTSLMHGDDGGQYDDAPKGSEPHSSCKGYNSYVEILSYNMFCIRCCKTTDVDSPDSPCNMHRDTEGCVAVIGGSYASGFTNEDQSNGSNSSSSTKKTTSSTTTKKSTTTSTQPTTTSTQPTTTSTQPTTTSTKPTTTSTKPTTTSTQPTTTSTTSKTVESSTQGGNTETVPTTSQSDVQSTQESTDDVTTETPVQTQTSSISVSTPQILRTSSTPATTSNDSNISNNGAFVSSPSILLSVSFTLIIVTAFTSFFFA